MKTILLKGYTSVALTVLLLAISMGVSRAQVIYYQNGFTNSGSFTTLLPRTYNPPPIWIGFDYGTATAQATATNLWASGPTYDAGGSAASGSAEISWTWNSAVDTGGGSAAFTVDLFANQITNAAAISFDIYLAPSSTPGLAGDYGYFQVFTRDSGYDDNVIAGFGEGLLTAAGGVVGQWAHVNIPLSGINTNVRAITLQDYTDGAGGTRDISGPETIYIDNLTIYETGALVPPTNSIALTGTKGLYLLTTPNSTVDTPQYQRQGIETTASGYSWVGSGSNPVKYSMTITNYPGSANSNFEAYIFLVPGTPTEPNPDWHEADCAMLFIQNNADGSAIAQFQYKLDDAEDNEYDNLGSVTNPPSLGALGTWSVSFTTNDGVVLTAPGGDTLSTNLVPGDGGNFANPLTVYLGVQPNSTNNTGQQAIFSQFQIISNGVSLLSDSFATPTLSNQWAVAAEDPNGVLQVPPSAAYLLSWNPPEVGFILQTNSNLASTNWNNPGLPIYTFNGKGTVLIPASMVATNKTEFFRMVNP